MRQSPPPLWHCLTLLTIPSPPSTTIANPLTLQSTNKMIHRQRYSHYLPLKRPSRTTSRSASLNKDDTRSPPKDKPEGRNGRGTTTSSASKRRSTMNSRGADYDEAEALRRAIEASKEEAAPEQTEPTTRRTKRGRSDSEEYVHHLRYPTSITANSLQESQKARGRGRALGQPLPASTRLPRTLTTLAQRREMVQNPDRGAAQQAALCVQRRQMKERSEKDKGLRQQTSERVEPNAGELMVRKPQLSRRHLKLTWIQIQTLRTSYH